MRMAYIMIALILMNVVITATTARKTKIVLTRRLVFKLMI